MVMFRVLVPVVHEVENAMSLLQKYTSTSFRPDVEDGAVIERDADPAGERLEILDPTGWQRPV
jgi:hypothetical protein